jgi:hypothetical protein
VGPSPPQSDDDEQPRMKIHIDRIEPVVGRIARQLEQTQGSQQPSAAPSQPYHFDVSSFENSDLSSFDLPSQDFGLSPGNPYVQALSFDLVSVPGLNDVPGGPTGPTSDAFQYPHISTMPTPGHTAVPNGVPQPFSALDEERSLKQRSPLLCQLFNNEMFSRSELATDFVTEKFQSMTFSQATKHATDAQKLLSVINTEPYLLDVLDVSAKWWLAWRDQAFALQDAFVFGRQEPEFEVGLESSIMSPLSLRGSPASPSEPYSAAKPIALRDFVRIKLLKMQDPVAIATGVLCIAMSLEQIRCGGNESKLNLSAAPSELADRLTLAVDTIILSPTARPEYAQDPGVLLLLMMRAKMYAESNQLRKCWLSTRRALDVAKNIRFAEIDLPSSVENGRPRLSEAELTNLFHRQRFIGSIMELDRLMSMVLGFPHAQDVKFTDRLALSVLRDSNSIMAKGALHASCDMRMRALRRVVSIAAGRVNDRNASSAADHVVHAATMDIQKSLDEAFAAMPEGWWQPSSHLGAEPFAAHEHLVAQMWFWQVQAFLHMPFMLKPNPNMKDFNCQDAEANDPYSANRTLCLEGCRRMLRVFTTLRANPALAVFICNCEDFQGVFASCILMVGLLIKLTCK